MAPLERISRVDVLPAMLPVRPHEDETRGAAQQHVFLRLETDGGVVGWGEARALPSWTGETLETITIVLRDYFAPVLLGVNPFARNAVAALLDEIVTGAMPSAKAAVDIALHDLQGRIAGLPIHELFGGKVRDQVRLTPSIRADTPEAMGELAARFAGARSLKVKISGDVTLDVARLEAVRAAAPTVAIWLDANQNYTPTKALALFERIGGVDGVACLQQPMPSGDWLGMARLRARSPLPLAVDEGCFGVEQVLPLAQLGVADLVVLKVCKAGGLRPLAEMAAVARRAGLDLLGSGLTESGIGLAAAVHLCSTLDLRLPPQLNGVQFLDDLCVAGLEVEGSVAVRVPSRPGLGVEVDEERIRAYGVEV